MSKDAPGEDRYLGDTSLPTPTEFEKSNGARLDQALVDLKKDVFPHISKGKQLELQRIRFAKNLELRDEVYDYLMAFGELLDYKNRGKVSQADFDVYKEKMSIQIFDFLDPLMDATTKNGS